MRYASVCDGISAASAAWRPLGWSCAWVSEIDPFCNALIEQRWGHTNLGDMLKVTEADIEKHGRFDLLVGGTPCQSFSVAGLRKGMDDPRGNLALRFCQLAGIARPRWVVWENVPGVLSSGAGEDFGSIVRGLEELGYGVAWRSLDAQYFGLAQRRKRVFVVGYLGDWRRACAVLLEREGVQGDSAPGRETGEGTALSPCLRAQANSSHRLDTQAFVPEISPALKRRDFKGPSSDGDGDGAPLIAHALTASGFDASEDGTGRWTPIVPVAFDWQSGGSKSRAGNLSDRTSALSRGQTPAVAFAQNQRDEIRTMDTAGALQAEPGMKQQTFLAVAFAQNQEGELRTGEIVSTLGRTSGNATARTTAKAMVGAAVRRLTPRECERLQGFPACIQRTTIEACIDHQNNAVRVEVQCRRWQSNASPVVESGSIGSVLFADSTLQNDPECRGSLVAAHVRTSFAPKAVAIRSRGRFLWSAGGADSSGWCLPSIRPESFAAAIAAAAHALAHSATDGRAESPQHTRSFTLPATGRWLAAMFGQGNAACANGAESARIAATTFITESHTQHTRHSGLTEATWLSFVMDAMTSFIPGGTPPERSCKFVIDNEIDYTLIQVRGKPAADGPRYAALGNSMAVPCMVWLGRRIQFVEEICTSAAHAK
jgi:DNA (cytosine-5)-methyltransferase 1